MTYRHLPAGPALHRKPCSTCRGTGRYLYDCPAWLTPHFEGACWRCDGLGYAWRPLTLAERLKARLAAILERLTRTPARARTMALRTDRSGAKGDVT